MRVTPETVASEHEWVRGRADVVVPLVNEVRADLGTAFGTTVDPITDEEYRQAVDAVFTDGDRAVNVAALVGLLRDLDVQDDYPGFVVDELLGRELAAMIAGEQPLRLLAEATFHYADVRVDSADDRRESAERTSGQAASSADDRRESAGADDLDAALAAGVQTRLPGWEWRESPSPFGPV